MTSEKAEVILFAPVGEDSPLRAKLVQVIDKSGLRKAMVECRSTIAFMNCLRRTDPHLDIAVLLAPDPKSLIKIVLVREFLKDFRVVLILPDGEEDTITLGHSFKPRYLTYADGNFEDLVAVLEKMRKHSCL